MHICYLADARSPIAQSWVAHFAASAKYRVTVISSYPCAADAIPGATIIQFPFALSSLAPTQGKDAERNRNRFLQRMSGELRGPRALAASVRVRSWFAPFQIEQKARKLSALLEQLRPDLIHAMRLPFEGFLAAAAVKSAPLLISIWGNDFSLFAERSRRLAKLTESALRRADGLHCDCRHDLESAFARGFSPAKPSRVLPGNGGVVTAAYFQIRRDPELLRKFGIPADVQLIVNPRGFRAYIHNETFFRAVPRVLSQIPQAFFLAVGMAENPTAERWARRTGRANSVRLLPTQTRKQLAILLASSQVSVSPSSHDGTPNTLLEAMACGCFPVAGDLPSLREWIVNGENGFLCDANHVESLADCLVRALRDPALREQAAIRNRELVRSRAEYRVVMEEVERLYEKMVAGQRIPLAYGHHTAHSFSASPDR